MKINKIAKKISVLALLLATFSTLFLLGGNSVTASAATVNYDILREQNIAVNDQFATIQVKVDKNTFEKYGVKVAIYNEMSYEQDLQSLTYAGVKYYQGGNKVESVYNYDIGKYEVTFTIYKNTIEEKARAYFYVVYDNNNLYEDINGGYGYQIW